MQTKSKEQFVLDDNVADATYTTSSGGVAVDIVKLAQSSEGRARLKDLLNRLKTEEGLKKPA